MRYLRVIGPTRQVADEALYRSFRGGTPGSNQTFALVNAFNTPYTAKPTDTLIELDDSSGQVRVNMETGPVLLTQHTIKKITSNQTNDIVGGGGPNIESFVDGTLGATTSIGGNKAEATWQWDGTNWVIKS